jgi:hypothetical protein
VDRRRRWVAIGRMDLVRGQRILNEMVEEGRGWGISWTTTSIEGERHGGRQDE